MLRLILPSIELEEDCKNYIKEHYDHGETKVSGDGGMSSYDEFSHWVEVSENSRNNINIKEGFVPSTTFLLYNEQKLIGMINIRHYLNGQLLSIGGHIGYSVRPSERRKGYCKVMLNMALDYCKKSLNLDRVLLTCDQDNEGSKKVIIANGGILENEIYHENMKRYTQRYWIEIK